MEAKKSGIAIHIWNGVFEGVYTDDESEAGRPVYVHDVDDNGMNDTPAFSMEIEYKPERVRGIRVLCQDHEEISNEPVSLEDWQEIFNPLSRNTQWVNGGWMITRRDAEDGVIYTVDNKIHAIRQFSYVSLADAIRYVDRKHQKMTEARNIKPAWEGPMQVDSRATYFYGDFSVKYLGLDNWEITIPGDDCPEIVQMRGTLADAKKYVEQYLRITPDKPEWTGPLPADDTPTHTLGDWTVIEHTDYVEVVGPKDESPRFYDLTEAKNYVESAVDTL